MLCIEMCKSAASAEEALNEPRAALSGEWEGSADISGENGGEASVPFGLKFVLPLFKQGGAVAISGFVL